MSKTREYYEQKHPVKAVTFYGRPLPWTNEKVAWDIRRFIWGEDVTILFANALAGVHETDDLDSVAHRCQRWVKQHIQYTHDADSMRTSEFWLFPNETFALKRGDCEDGAFLLASMICNAIPKSEQWRCRVAAGWVAYGGKQEGHAYCCWCRLTDNEWVILDWCYWPDETVPVPDKPVWDTVPSYKEVWFSTDCINSYSHRITAVSGRMRGVRQ